VQALFVAIPPSMNRDKARAERPADNDNFDHARRQADKALRQLFTQ